MKPESQKCLMDMFPCLFRRGPCFSAEHDFFQFEIGEGWFNLIWELSIKLHPYFEEHEELEIHQIKSKFGGLRFYTGGLPKDIACTLAGFIQAAEHESVTICEVCGEEADPERTQYVTLCPLHHVLRSQGIRT